MRFFGPWRRRYECRVYLAPEEGGGFSVVAANLPGVASQGETEEEALANIVEAFQGVIAEYARAGTPIPWAEKTKPLLKGWAERQVSFWAKVV